MHDIIEKGLEDYLAGSRNREFVSHLADCQSCRKDVEGIQEVSSLLTLFRTEEHVEPSLGFEARLMRNIREQRAHSFWNIFNVEPAFTRKIAFGALLSLAILGSYLATENGDSMAVADHTPEAVMANHDPSQSDDQRLDGMLVTLATYHQ